MADTSAAGMVSKENERKAQIVRVSVIGIIANVALAAFKATVGLLSNSIAIVLDAVNNLSDAASSIITIVGTRLAGKQPDKKHPYGYGRIEYLTTIVVSAIVLWAGITSLSESVQGIIHPEAATYEAVTLIIVAAAVVVKLVLGRYVKAEGKRLGADALVASGEDATMDSIISASTLVAAFIFLFTGISLEAWLGAIISVVIIKSGIEMLGEALGKVLGERVDADVTTAIREAVTSVDHVRGAYDLFLTDYGPQRLQGSVHVEVDEQLTARDIDRLTREIQAVVYRKTGVILHTVGIYSTNTTDGSETARIRQALQQIVDEDEDVLQFHGLYVDESIKGANFDLVVGFGPKSRQAVVDRALEKMQAQFPEYGFSAVLDSDVSD